MAKMGEVLNLFTVDMLKALCRRRGLNVTGNKSKLKRRLSSSYKGNFDELTQNLYKYEILNIYNTPELNKCSVDKLRKIVAQCWSGDWDEEDCDEEDWDWDEEDCDEEDCDEDMVNVLCLFTILILKRLSSKNDLKTSGNKSLLAIGLSKYYKGNFDELAQDLYKYEIVDTYNLSCLDHYSAEELREIIVQHWNGEININNWQNDENEITFSFLAEADEKTLNLLQGPLDKKEAEKIKGPIIYFAISQGELCYIGHTSKPSTRFPKHKKVYSNDEIYILEIGPYLKILEKEDPSWNLPALEHKKFYEEIERFFIYLYWIKNQEIPCRNDRPDLPRQASTRFLAWLMEVGSKSNKKLLE